MVERMGQCRLSELLGYAQEALVFGGVCPEMVSHSIIVVMKSPPTKFFSLLKLAALEDITKISTHILG